MPVQVSYPGVYLQEVPSGVRTIAGVSTSTALFVGASQAGPLRVPTQVTSYSEFVRAFGDDTSKSELARAVKLFFLNGGTVAWISRVANGASAASVVLHTEAGAASLVLTARDAGVAGEFVRAAVDYDTEQPESTFNLEVFRWKRDASGSPVKSDVELFRNLTMDAAAPLFAPDVLTQQSKLVRAAAGAGVARANGSSQSGRLLVASDGSDGAFHAAWSAVITATCKDFRIKLGTRPWVTVSLPLAEFTSANNAKTKLGEAILAAYANAGERVLPAEVTVDFVDVALTTPSHGLALKITGTGQDVLLAPAPRDDAGVSLMLGTAQGGIEVGAFGASRPAPTGLTLRLTGDAWEALVPLLHNAWTTVTVNGSGPIAFDTGADPAEHIAVDSAGGSDGVRETLRAIARAINNRAAAVPAFRFNASVWGSRLAVRRVDGDDVAVPSLVGVPAALVPFVGANVRYYSVGTGGTTGKQGPGTPGDDGAQPEPADYDAAYADIDRAVDLFNLMVLPQAGTLDMTTLWANASVFCQQRRAFLVMDPPPSWTADPTTATSGVSTLRIGLAKQYAGVFFPRLLVNEGGRTVTAGPAGAIAGLMARIDSTRGVWKAPAGTEADLRGITGVEHRFTDLQNGQLNPRAINAIRVFPDGVVNWGARTMDGDDNAASEYKYIPIRRLALLIEESLYRGLKWVVFEPNDEPLWAQIRLNVGAFMHGLFRQGAFQGATPRQAYFVKCDAETTTQDDRNKGIVNVWVGFAPLKPAEFVVLYLQQMAGAIDV